MPLAVFIVNPQLMLGMFALFMIIAFLMLTLFRQLVLTNRPDLQANISFSVFCIYPFYKVQNRWCFRLTRVVTGHRYFHVQAIFSHGELHEILNEVQTAHYCLKTHMDTRFDTF